MARPVAKASAPLTKYVEKRDFGKTAEPAGKVAAKRRSGKLCFVVQKHWASRLHYDLRLELDGVMLSWAVPKGPCYDLATKQMAIHVEDHPLAYNFEGTIPARQYGAGTVIVWDRGTWEPVGEAREGLAKGKLLFKLHGQKLAGAWELVRISKPGDKQEQWMFFKKKDVWARPRSEYDVITALPDSVIEKPLGLVETREPRGVPPVPAVAAAQTLEPDLTLAVKARLPAKLEPQLATLATAPPTGEGGALDAKYDGYRMMCRIEAGKARLIIRGGHDWTAKIASLAAAVEALDVDSGWLDGEIVVMDAQGVPDFNALQNAIEANRNEQIRYFLFDAPFLNGMDLRRVPLWSRRAALQQLFTRDHERVHFSQDFALPAGAMLQAACQMGLEGVMASGAMRPMCPAGPTHG